MNKFLKVKSNTINNKGYAILFTIIIISTILTMGAGISNTLLKQTLLSSTARESQIAFYQSDTAIECAIYAAEVKGLAIMATPWECGLDDSNTPMSLNLASYGVDLYTLSVNTSLPGACFNIDINKSSSVVSPYTAEIKARGYNVCSPSNPKQVERGILVNY